MDNFYKKVLAASLAAFFVGVGLIAVFRQSNSTEEVRLVIPMSIDAANSKEAIDSRLKIKLLRLYFEEHRLRFNEYPNSLEGLERCTDLMKGDCSKLDSDALSDEWGNPFLLEQDSVGCFIRSLGADGSRGGLGSDADISEFIPNCR